MTVLGTRPEIIRLSGAIKLLNQYAEHVVVHTGQNYDTGLRDIFYEELGLAAPEVSLALPGGSFGTQVGSLFSQIEPLFKEHRPDRLLLLGDTNSGLVAIVARRLGIPVYHMEAGNRCYDDRVPEEVNRRIIDHSSTVLLPYTHNSKENLLAEGIPSNRIYVIGNPINECIGSVRSEVAASAVLRDLGVDRRKYFLVTLHRAENVDSPSRLKAMIDALTVVGRAFALPVLISTHPRTRDRLRASGLDAAEGLRFLDPWGFVDFLRLESDAFCVLSDSGTVQERSEERRVGKECRSRWSPYH